MSDIAYTWRISRFVVAPEFKGLPQAICAIPYELTATLGQATQSIVGTVQLPEPKPDSYTPFDEVTKEMAIEWVCALIDLEEHKQALAERLVPTAPTKTETVAVPWGQG